MELKFNPYFSLDYYPTMPAPLKVQSLTDPRASAKRDGIEAIIAKMERSLAHTPDQA